MPLAGVKSELLVSATKPALKITFNGDVSSATVSAGDLTMQNLTTGQTINCATSCTVAYDSTTRSATWTINIALADGNYHATLPQNSVADTSGNLLAALYPADFFILAGDANQNRQVDTADFLVMAQNFGKSSMGLGTGDFNFDGKVNALDFNILATKFGSQLAPAASSPIVTTAFEAPGVPAAASDISLFGDRRIATDRNDDLLV
jgi:Dockerin type I domain/Bacterial Ig-like domain